MYVRANMHICVFRRRKAPAPSRAGGFLPLQTLERRGGGPFPKSSVSKLAARSAWAPRGATRRGREGAPQTSKCRATAGGPPPDCQGGGSARLGSIHPHSAGREGVFFSFRKKVGLCFPFFPLSPSLFLHLEQTSTRHIMSIQETDVKYSTLFFFLSNTFCV